MQRLQRAEHCFWKWFPLPHDISGLYCNFPHGCPDTGCCVYENSLDASAEPPWRWRLCAGWAGLCVADTGSWEGQLLCRHLRGCEFSSPSTGTSAYLPQFQTVRRLGPLLLTAGDSRLGGQDICVASALICHVVLPEPLGNSSFLFPKPGEGSCSSLR